MPDEYVLDNFAMVAFYNHEPAEPLVRAILENLDNAIHVSTINLGELYYSLVRQRGTLVAERAVASVFAQPNVTIAQATWDRVQAAAEIKARGRMSYADAFAAALAQELSAPVVTGDPEFAPLEQEGMLQVVWLPRR